jgi:hypothetical protein
MHPMIRREGPAQVWMTEQRIAERRPTRNEEIAERDRQRTATHFREMQQLKIASESERKAFRLQYKRKVLVREDGLGSTGRAGSPCTKGLSIASLSAQEKRFAYLRSSLTGLRRLRGQRAPIRRRALPAPSDGGPRREG